MSAFWKFVEEHAAESPAALRLKYHGKEAEDFDLAKAIVQIECRQRFGKKLADTLAACPRFEFPDALVGEQSTSDALAAEHVRIALEELPRCERQLRAIDLTAGLGIDALHLARAGVDVVAVELNPERAEALRRNAIAMGIAPERFEAVCADSTDYIRGIADRTFDIAFIDPARRDAAGGRVFALSDCQPDVVAMLPSLRRIARRLVVKMSPMLDVSQVASELPSPSQIAALGTATECKELVAVVDFDAEPSPTLLRAITVGTPTLCFTASEERAAEARFGTPVAGQTLYEPYPAVMKMAPFKILCERFGLTELQANSHLYFSEETRAADVPAQAYVIEAMVPWSSGEIKRFARRWPKISVATRNFPMAADRLRRKLGTTEGDGTLMLFATTLSGGEPTLIVSRRIIRKG